MYRRSGFMFWQLLAGVATAAVCIWMAGWLAGAAVIYGLLAMVANTAWLDRRLGAIRGLDVEAGQRSLYKGAVLRFAGLLFLLLVAGFLGLNLLYVALGMFVTQAVLFLAALARFRADQT